MSTATKGNDLAYEERADGTYYGEDRPANPFEEQGIPSPESERRVFDQVEVEMGGRRVDVGGRGFPGLADSEAVDAIDRAFGQVAVGVPSTTTGDPDPDELIGLVRRCEAAGFELRIWIEARESRDRKVVDYARRLSIRDPDGRRRPPDRLVLPLMARARVICGYLARTKSPFFPEPAADDDRRSAMRGSIADDRRLCEYGR